MFSLDEFMGLTSCWEYLKNCNKPIFIYGMGDGCVKLLRQFENYGIKETGIFASDEFVRGHSFMGHVVKKLSQVEEEYEDFVVVLAFGAGYDSLIEKIDNISRKHKLLVPDTAVVGGEPFTKEFLKENFQRAKKVYDLMADEFSKKVFEYVVRYKITGDISYLREITTLPCEAYENILGVNFKGAYVDLGAYNGDTVREFIGFTKENHGKIIAVEPNGRNYRKLCEYGESIPELTCINAACWSFSGEITFSKGGGRMAKADEKGVLTKCISVDDLVGDEGCEYIKYDVEGAEKEALEGSQNTIKSFSPKLCVALYHRLSDMIDIPLQIYEMNRNYKFYVRHYPYYPAWETNLFCI